MAIAETDTEVHTPFEQDFEKDVAATQRYFDSSRFAGIIRLYTARQVVEQHGTIQSTTSWRAAGAFYEHVCANSLRSPQEHHDVGPYSPGQAVSMKRMGIEGDLHSGGWATSAKISIESGARPRQPMSQVPDDAAVLVRALPGPQPTLSYACR